MLHLVLMRSGAIVSHSNSNYGFIMCVDMFERRFRQELEKLPLFTPNDKRDARVWKADFPAWRSLFSSSLLFGHATGYRLPSFDSYFAYCENAFCVKHPKKDRFIPFFQGELREGMRQRIGAWYESGMAETYLYVCLVEAIEDHMKAGMVLYDPRADWKLKADAMVMLGTQLVRISSYVGEKADRPGIEARRDQIEKLRKVNTANSAHWGNSALDALPELAITRTDASTQIINGVRLFDRVSINRLLQELYAVGGIQKGWVFPVMSTNVVKKAA